ncbi:MAG TPA: hypothetical protein VFE10_14595 [Phenylobacterium sp.]|jgi:hypothetical protein|nr:hypothetical protein [Phenylobacterium sp.]
MTYAPRAIRHFGQAAIEARAERTRRFVGPSDQQVRPAPRPGRVVVRLWLPMTAIFLLLAPFAILAIPFLYLAPLLRRLNCAAAVFTLGRALLALGGTDIDVRTPDAVVRLKIF